MKSLQQTLSYQHPQMPLRIQRAVGCKPAEAKKIFSDMKAWLWLCARHRKLIKNNPGLKHEIPSLRMLQHFKPIDLAWHEFILMTREYEGFCLKYLGEFVHHTPALLEKNLKTKQKVDKNSELDSYFSFIYDNLGEVFFHRWIHDFPKIRSSK